MRSLSRIFREDRTIPSYAAEAIEDAEQLMSVEQRNQIERALSSGNVTINVFVVAVGGGAHVGNKYCNTDGRCH